MARLTNQDQDQVSFTSGSTVPESKEFVLCIFLLAVFLQEVKECAISCMGLVVSTFGDNLKAELPACLPVLVDRMGNEITRLTAVKVIVEALPSSITWLTYTMPGVLDFCTAQLYC